MSETQTPVDYVALCERAAGHLDTEGSGSDDERQDVVALKSLAAALLALREAMRGCGEKLFTHQRDEQTGAILFRTPTCGQDAVLCSTCAARLPALCQSLTATPGGAE